MHGLSFPASLTVFFFFFNDTATTEIYTLSLHDALPISQICKVKVIVPCAAITLVGRGMRSLLHKLSDVWRSEEHTSELQSQSNLVCRLLLEKKKKKNEQAAVRSMQERLRNLRVMPPRLA